VADAEPQLSAPDLRHLPHRLGSPGLQLPTDLESLVSAVADIADPLAANTGETTWQTAPTQMEQVAELVTSSRAAMRRRVRRSPGRGSALGRPPAGTPAPYQP
jgi:hypothetical protein